MDPIASTPFSDLDDFVALHRVSGLALAPDGTRLVVSVGVLDESGTDYVSSLWQVDPAGGSPARRLTWGAKSESAPVFLPDGSLLFLSSRPDPDVAAEEDGPGALWLLPADGGEARPLARRPGGVASVVVAQASNTLVLASPTLPSSVTAEDDAQRRKTRKELKVTAVLHDSSPVRHWDKDLGPERDRLFVAAADPSDPTDLASGEMLELRDLTGHGRGAISAESTWDVSPDGRTVAVGWEQPEPGGSVRQVLLAIDLMDGSRRVLLDDPQCEYHQPRFSPDGSKISIHVEHRSDPDRAQDLRLAVLDLGSGQLYDAAPGWDHWPSSTVWAPDGTALLVTADHQGRAPVWRIDLATGAAVRLTAEDGAYTDLQLSRDGTALYALRSAIDCPPAPVRLDPRTVGQQPTPLLGPVEAPAVPGTLVDLQTTAEDGFPVRGWLVLPVGASAERPAPLLLWVHGGPLSSWNGWSWRWNPWLAAAQGYAVLLPDPALSTGYGQAGIVRGWGGWGTVSYTDLLTLTDTAVSRADIDADRTAAMGGSYGGYMANWIAGHTDRFRGIVSHAGLWDLDQFVPTTDRTDFWRRVVSPEMAALQSPSAFVDQISTPMLVIHGDRDYRVPVGESLRLWAELAERNSAADGKSPHRFLLFPDENHWVLKPQHAKIWYETVFAFLAHTVHGRPWETPTLLR